MLVLVVSLFLMFGAVELQRVWLDARSTVELERAARVLAAENARRDCSSAERARRAYAIRCSCDGRDQ